MVADKKDNSMSLPDPEIEPKFVEAFICLLLYKCGGRVSMKLDLLKKFPEGKKTILEWDEANKCFVLSLDGVTPPSIIDLSKKRLIL